jgi:hypothetical protein
MKNSRELDAFLRVAFGEARSATESGEFDYAITIALRVRAAIHPRADEISSYVFAKLRHLGQELEPWHTNLDAEMKFARFISKHAYHDIDGDLTHRYAEGGFHYANVPILVRYPIPAARSVVRGWGRIYLYGLYGDKGEERRDLFTIEHDCHSLFDDLLTRHDARLKLTVRSLHALKVLTMSCAKPFGIGGGRFDPSREVGVDPEFEVRVSDPSSVDPSRFDEVYSLESLMVLLNDVDSIPGSISFAHDLGRNEPNGIAAAQMFVAYCKMHGASPEQIQWATHAHNTRHRDLILAFYDEWVRDSGGDAP